jgi:hypothetical protein
VKFHEISVAETGRRMDTSDMDTVSMDTAFSAVLHIRIAKVLQFLGKSMQYCNTSILQYSLRESIRKYPCISMRG